MEGRDAKRAAPKEPPVDPLSKPASDYWYNLASVLLRWGYKIEIRRRRLLDRRLTEESLPEGWPVAR